MTPSIWKLPPDTSPRESKWPPIFLKPKKHWHNEDNSKFVSEVRNIINEPFFDLTVNYGAL